MRCFAGVQRHRAAAGGGVGMIGSIAEDGSETRAVGQRFWGSPRRLAAGADLVVVPFCAMAGWQCFADDGALDSIDHLTMIRAARTGAIMRLGTGIAVALMQMGAPLAAQGNQPGRPERVVDLFSDAGQADITSKARRPEPVGNQGDWFPHDAYPPEARNRREQGRVSVAVDVGIDGRPTSCAIEASSGFGALDGKTCDLAMANARFKPALDLQGRPIPGRFAMRNVVWMLDAPGIDVDAGPMPVPMTKTMTMIDAEGRITGCHNVLADGSRGESCPASMIGQMQGLIARRGGIAVPGLITATMSVTIEAIDQSRP